jgi:hypothetical protein
MGFQDDWSYIRTTMEYARTGHFVYNGWATAMLGWMVPWGALFIKLFGFSFTAVRMSTVPLAMATSYLLHSSFRRLGLGAANAILATLTIVLSPAYFPMETSFMTDVAGMLAIVLCLFLCLRAVDAETERASMVWLCLAAATNVVGGTARQISWLGVLVMVPSTAWLLYRRGRRSAPMVAGVLWVASFGAIVALLHWWSRQPYSVPEHLNRGPVTFTMVKHFGGKLVKGVLCFLLLVFPVLVGWVGQARTLSRGALIRTAAVVAAMALFLGLTSHSLRYAWSMPWVGHLLFSVIWGRGEFPGGGPGGLGLTTRVVLSLVVVATGMIVFELALASRREQSPEATPKERWEGVDLEILYVLGPFSLAYLALLMPRTLYEFLYDRYLVGLMPIACLLLLRWHQKLVAPRIPAVSFVVLAVFSLFTLAGTHDWFAVNRARILAVQEVHASGVPKTAIQGGFEYDGWTQIEANGYVNEKRIEVPRGAFHAFLPRHPLPMGCEHFFWLLESAIDPKYVVTSSPMSCFDPSEYPAVAYRNWLPPFERRVYVLKIRDAER